MISTHRRLDWLLPKWLEDASAYSQIINEDIYSVLGTFAINAFILIVCITIFSFYRRIYPEIYCAKYFIMPKCTPKPMPSQSLFGWIGYLVGISDSVLLEKGGLDIFFFIRFYRLALTILLYYSVYCLGVLLMVNGIGRTDHESSSWVAFDHWSMTNIQQQSVLLWLHLAGIIMVTGITIFFLEKEFIVYAKLRHTFLRQSNANMRTVVVEGIPYKLRSSTTLRMYFEALYPGTVVSVQLAQDLRYLKRVITQRESIVTKLERCLYQEHKSGDKHERPLVRVGEMDQGIDAIKHYTQLLQELNRAVAKEQSAALRLGGMQFSSSSSRLDSAAKADIMQEFLKITQIGKLKKLAKQGPISGDTRLTGAGASAGGRNSSYDGPSWESSDEYIYQGYQYSTRVATVEKQSSAVIPPTGSMGVSYGSEVDLEAIADSDGDSDGGSDDQQYNHNKNNSISIQQQQQQQQQQQGSPGQYGQYSGGRLRPLLVYEMTFTEFLHTLWTAPSLVDCWRALKQGRQGYGYQGYGYYNLSHQEPSAVAAHLFAEHDNYDDDDDDYSVSDSILNHSHIQYGGKRSNNSNSSKTHRQYTVEYDAVLQGSGAEEETALIRPLEERRLFLSKAFVTFKTFTSATIARQVVHMQLVGRMSVREAPEPRDIVWKNLYTSRKVSMWRKFVVDVLVTLMIVLWVAPVTLLSFVFSKSAIMQRIPLVATLCARSQIVSSMVDLLQPLAIMGIMNLLPPLLSAASILEGCTSYSESQFRSFYRYFAFQIVNVFLVTTIAGSVVDALQKLYDSPDTAFELLGASLPKMGGFFMNFILVKAFTGLGMEIIRLPAACFSLPKKLLTPNETPRDWKRQAFFGACRNMNNPGGFPFAKICAQDMLTFTVCATYACISPLIIIAGLCYFSLASFIYKHQMLYIYEPMFESGGRWWPIMARCFVIALIFAQSTMVGMMILKGSMQQAYILFVVIAATAVYYWHRSAVYEPLASQLPLDIAMAMDHEEARLSIASSACDRVAPERDIPAGIAPHTTATSAAAGRAAGDIGSVAGPGLHSSQQEQVPSSEDELRTGARNFLQPELRAGPEAPTVQFPI